MNNSLAHLHPDFASGTLSGRAVPLPSMYNNVLDHLAGRDAASAYFPPAPAGVGFGVGSYRGYADAIMEGRHAGVAASGDLLLPTLSRELQRNLLTTGGFGKGDGVSGVGQHHRSLLLEQRLIEEERLLQEENFLRQYDAHARVHDRALEADLAYRALQQQQNLQQQHRQQGEMLLAESFDRRIAALKEHQAQQQLAATSTAGGAGGELGGLGSWAASQASYGGYAQAEQLRLAEEAATIRERLAHRRVLQHHLGGSGGGNSFLGLRANSLSSAPASNDTLSRLLQLRRIPDEDLIRRAAEVHQNSLMSDGLNPMSGGVGRSAVDSLLERQLLEAHLLRSGAGGGGGGGISGGGPMFNPGGRGQAGIDGALTAAASISLST